MGKIRDAERTKKAILEAASKEFTEKGYAGARVSSIAKQANVNIQMIYHYFDTKEMLYTKTMEMHLEPLTRNANNVSIDPITYMGLRFQEYLKSSDYFRAATWEAAQADGFIMDETVRKQAVDNGINYIEALQRMGIMHDKWDPRLFWLAMQSMMVYPIVFWQSTYFATGKMPTDPDFQKMWSEFLDSFSEALWGIGTNKG
jgi:AcrR family transcriptional regulator